VTHVLPQIMGTIERILYATDEEESRQAMLETQKEIASGNFVAQ